MQTTASCFTQYTSKTLSSVVTLSTNKLRRLQAKLEDGHVNSAWNSLGVEVSEALRLGKGVRVKGLGDFTFLSPSFKTEGMTFSFQSRQEREIVFIVSRSFCPELELLQGVFRGRKPAPIPFIEQNLPTPQLNQVKCALRAGLSKEDFQVAVSRVVELLSKDVRAGNQVLMFLPAVGTFYCKARIFAVKFLDYLRHETASIHTLDLRDRVARLRKKVLPMDRTQNSLPKLCRTREFTKYKFASKRPDEEDDLEKEAEEGEKESMEERIFRFEKRLNDSIKRRSQVQLMPVRKLKSFLKSNKHSAESFWRLLVRRVSSPGEELQQLDQKKFLLAFHKSKIFELYEDELSVLFDIMDKDKDGRVSLEDWQLLVLQDRTTLCYLKSILDRESLLDLFSFKRKMRIRNQRLTAGEVVNVVLRYDPLISEAEAKQIVLKLLRNQETITPQQIYSRIIGKDDEDHLFLQTFRNRLFEWLEQDPARQHQATALFEKYDISNSGQVDNANFQTCLLKLKFGADSKAVARFVQMVSKDSLHGTINYSHFLRGVLAKRDKYRAKRMLEALIDLLKDFCCKRKIGYNEIYSALFEDEKVDSLSNQQFVELIRRRLIGVHAAADEQMRELVQASDKDLLQLASGIDLDRDGRVNREDLVTFLLRWTISDNQDLELKSREFKLFPTRQTSTAQQLWDYLQFIQRKLDTKKKSPASFYKEIDLECNGFITFEQFDSAMADLTGLPSKARESLFIVFDHLSIGFVREERFVDLLNRKNMRQDSKIVDCFDWQQKVVEKLNAWISKNRYDHLQAFKAINQSGDGVIKPEEMQAFLYRELRMPQNEIYPTRMNRLFKVFDSQKNNSAITVADFIRALQRTEDAGKWIESSLHQLGRSMSKEFRDLGESFDRISGLQPRVSKAMFFQWVNSKLLLSGFNLTRDMEQQLFARLDHHRKGYLIQTDFEQAFSCYFKQQVYSVQEIQTKLYSALGRKADIWDYFSADSQGQFISRASFVRGVRGLKLGVTDQQAESFWALICKGLDSPNEVLLSRQEFQDFFFSFTNEELVNRKQPESEFRQLLRKLSGYRKRLFENLGGSQKVRVIDFKKQLRKLKAGFLSKQIDLLISHITKEQDVDLHTLDILLAEFKEATRNPHLAQLVQRMQELRIHPLEVFKQMDCRKTGLVAFEDFMEVIGSKVNYSQNSFYILSELFRQVDFRRDGYVDIDQWLQACRGTKREARNTSNYLELERSISRSKNELARILKTSESEPSLVGFSGAVEAVHSEMEKRQVDASREDIVLVLEAGRTADSLDYGLALKIVKDRVAGN